MQRQFFKFFRKIRDFFLRNKITARIVFITSGILATLWFLLRVIPKPSRAAYPCMQAAAPLMSTFVIYLTGFFSSALAFKGWKRLRRSFSWPLLLLVALLFSSGVFLMINGSADELFALGSKEVVTFDQQANAPVGEARGIFPGRVVWAHNPDATNEKCTNMIGDGYFLAKNNNQQVIDKMLSDVLQKLTAIDNDSDAWNKLFQTFNQRKKGAAAGYQDGEKIFIKINATSSWDGNFDDSFNKKENRWYGIAETSPQMMLAVLRQLVYQAGVPQSSIYIGDPMRIIYAHSYALLQPEFPDVHYIGQKAGKGREAVVPAEKPSVFYSDKGKVLSVKDETLYRILEEADYMINLPQMKGHARAGITLFAKNHFGSHTRKNAQHLHDGLVAPNGKDPVREGEKKYRVQVDIMGHPKLCQNSLVYILDALWAGSEAVDPPTKWYSAPFNGDWTSSIFASQDQVAIESVAYDFLRAEYDGSRKYKELGGERISYPQYYGVDDYLQQAASNKFWPAGIIYDPDGDGIPIPSLGVHEHWNNSVDKQYSRNLGSGKGIELVSIPGMVRRTVMAPQAETAPVIDGQLEDECWKEAQWYPIDQVWLPYQGQMQPDDFSGRFKTCWDEKALYLLAEIQDDVLVTDNPDPLRNYPNYDCLELFLDEDASGGEHKFNHNAFAYHISTEGRAVDLDSDGDWTAKEYKHLIVKRLKHEGKYYWEMAIEIYDDNYQDNLADASLLLASAGKNDASQSGFNRPQKLKAGKLMGFSLAYCDNDDPDEEKKTRDNFIGSVPVSRENKNAHWHNADDFGRIKLCR